MNLTEKIKIYGILLNVLTIIDFFLESGILILDLIMGILGFYLYFSLFYLVSVGLNNKKPIYSAMFSFVFFTISFFFLYFLLLSIALAKPEVVDFSDTSLKQIFKLILSQIYRPIVFIITLITYLIYILGAEFYRKAIYYLYELTKIKYFKIAGEVFLVGAILFPLLTILFPLLIGKVFLFITLFIEILGFLKISNNKIKQ